MARSSPRSNPFSSAWAVVVLSWAAPGWLSCASRKAPIDSGDGGGVAVDGGGPVDGGGAGDGGGSGTGTETGTGDAGGSDGGAVGENDLDHAVVFEGEPDSDLGRALGAGALGPGGAMLVLVGAPGLGAGELQLFLWDDEGVVEAGQILGKAEGDSAGSAVSVLDLDGDGVDDLVVAARRSDTLGVNAGEAAAFFGPIAGGFSFEDADGSWVSEVEGGYCGSALAVAWSGASAHLAVGCGLGEGGASRSGLVHLVPATGPDARPLEQQAVLTLLGVGKGDAAGAALASGDLDGDGVDELAVGAFGQGGSAGAFWVVSSDERGSLGLADAASAWMSGGESFDLLAYSLVMADLDTDGLDELYVGAPGRDATGPETGQVLRFLEPVGELDESLAEGRLVADSYARLGWSLAGLADDGIGEALLIGAPGEGDSSGAAWRVRLPVEGVRPVEPGTDERWTGAGPLEGLGATVGEAPHYGDGEAGVLLGAPDGSRAWLWTGG